MSGSVTGSDTPSILERDLRGTFLNAGAGEGPAPNYRVVFYHRLVLERQYARPRDGFVSRATKHERCLQNVRCCLLLRKKPCPESLLRHVNPATRDVQRKKPTLSVCPYRSTLTGDDPKSLVLTSTHAGLFTWTNHRRDGFSESKPLREPLNRLRWIPQVTLP